MMRLGHLLVPWALAACGSLTVDLSGRPCTAGDDCLDGFECHSEEHTCVPELARGCDTDGGVCVWSVSDGDACAVVGSFLPCADGISDCAPGCRTCEENATWSPCSEATCILGEVWSCASCEDDCRRTVVGAEPVCLPLTPPRCNYDGSCWGEHRDVDGLTENGCECLPTGVEVCDGIDNDCSGDADEGFDLGGDCGVGECIGGVWECDVANPSAHRCTTMPGGSVDASTYESCDGADNDCDGEVDDGLPCALGATEPCDVGVGPGSGLFTCSAPNCTWGSCQPVWWDAEWSRRLRIDVDTASLGGAVANLPVPVVLSPSVVTYSDFLAAGADVQFVDMDGTTVLAHEMETWNSAGESVFWVTLDAVEPAPAKRFFVMYYGRSSPVSGPPASDVWGSDFAAVWHLAESAAGRGSLALYGDASGNGHHGDDFTASDDATGVVGRGQGFGGDGDHLLVASPAFLADDTSTVEAWVQGAAGARWVFPITLSAPTAVNGQQLVVRLDATFDYAQSESQGADLRFFDESLRPVPHWRALWNDASGDSTIWVRVPYAGTSELRMYLGSANAVSKSDPEAVFDFYDDFAGTDVDTNKWAIRSIDYTVADGDLTLRAGAIGLLAALPFNLADGYLVEVRVRFDGLGSYYSGTAPEISSSQFVQGSNGGSDATGFMMRRVNGRELEVWAADGSTADYNLTVNDYLRDTVDSEWLTCSIAARSDRLTYYFGATDPYPVTGITWSKELRYLSLGDFAGGATIDIMDTSYRWIRVRKLGAMPTATVGAATAAGLSSLGTVGLGATATMVTASVGSVIFESATSPGWRYLALVRDGTSAALYVDGSVVDTAVGVLPVVMVPESFLIGDLVGLVGSADEVRVSEIARSPAWIAAQHAAVRGTLLTLGQVETAP